MIQHVGWGSGYNFHFKLHDQLDLVCIVFDPNKEYSDEDGNSYRGAYTDSIETRDFVESVAGTLGFRLPPISDPVEFPSQRRFRRR